MPLNNTSVLSSLLAIAVAYSNTGPGIKAKLLAATDSTVRKIRVLLDGWINKANLSQLLLNMVTKLVACCVESAPIKTCKVYFVPVLMLLLPLIWLLPLKTKPSSDHSP